MNRATENQYREGARPRIRGTFTDDDGAAFTPTTHTLTVRQPDGGGVDVYTDAATPSGSDPNVLERRLPAVTTPGRWHYRFAADDGLHFAVDEASFFVFASEVEAE